MAQAYPHDLPNERALDHLSRLAGRPSDTGGNGFSVGDEIERFAVMQNGRHADDDESPL